MLGAIVGDIVGSDYEFNNHRSKEFEFFTDNKFFTDDTVLTLAVCKACLKFKGDYFAFQKETKKAFLELGHAYPPNGKVGYGKMFLEWLENPKPYQSFGNGAVMRISPVAYIAKDEEDLKNLVRSVTIVSHNHEQAMKSAEAVALCVYMALHGKTKFEIKKRIQEEYFSLDFDYEDLKKNNKFYVGSEKTAQRAIFCFLISNSFEDAIRTAISIGGDSDTLAATTGAIAGAFYGITTEIEEKALSFLDDNLRKVYFDFVELLNKGMPTEKLSFKDFQHDRLDFLKENANESFIVRKGTGCCMISAPHGVSQVRLGKAKVAEPGSLSLALYLQKLTNAHLIAKTKNCFDDANFEEICPYKTRLVEYVKENNILYLIDFHGLAKEREQDINIGIRFGQNVKTDNKALDSLMSKLKKAGFKTSLDVPFWGRRGTVAGTISEKCDVWSVLFEVNCKFTNDVKYKDKLKVLINILHGFIESINKKA